MPLGQSSAFSRAGTNFPISNVQPNNERSLQKEACVQLTVRRWFAPRLHLCIEDGITLVNFVKYGGNLGPHVTAKIVPCKMVDRRLGSLGVGSTKQRILAAKTRRPLGVCGSNS